MLVYNNKEYRNLQEQVEKNKADIEDWNSKEDTLANFGIKIIGKVQSVDQLPDVSDYDYGDAYMVGSDETADYNYYLATRPTAEVAEKHWQNIGKLSITGPEGPKGDEIKSFLTTKTQEINTGTTKYTHNTVTVTMSDGRQLQYIVTASAEKGDKGDKGDQGIQGIQGDKGDKGDTGEQGPQGEMGPTAPAYHIVGTVTSTSQLPDPALLKDLSAAYILETSDAKQLYIQVGLSLDVAKWEYLGELAASNYWELSNKILAPVETVDTVQIKKLAVLTAGGLSCSSPNISGVASCSAINSPSSSLTLSGKDGVELIHDGTTVLKTNSDGIQLSNADNSTKSEDRPIIVIGTSDNNLIHKTSNVTANGATGELKATKVTTTGDITSSGTISGTFKGNLTGDVTGNATTATTATTAKKIAYRSMRNDSANLDDNTMNGWNDSTGAYTYIPCVKAAIPFNNGTAISKEDAQIQNLCWDNNQWGMQIATTNVTDTYPHRQSMAFRNLSNGTWGSWHQMLNDIGNYDITGNWTHSGTNTFSGTNNFTGTLQKNGVNVATTTDVTNATASCVKTASDNTFTGLNTFTGTVKANSIIDNIHNQVIKGSSFRLAAGKYTLQTLLKMVFTTIPSDYTLHIDSLNSDMTVQDGPDSSNITTNVSTYIYDSTKVVRIYHKQETYSGTVTWGPEDAYVDSASTMLVTIIC